MDSLCWVIKKVLPQKVGYNLKSVKGRGKERGGTHTNSCVLYIPATGEKCKTRMETV